MATARARKHRPVARAANYALTVNVDPPMGADHCLAAAGAADTVAVMTRGAVVQLSCDPGTRGRVLAAEQVVGVAAPQLGNFRAGAMGAVMPPGVALVGGGVLCVVAVVGIALSHPGLRRFWTDAPG